MNTINGIPEQTDQTILDPPYFYDVTLRDGNQALAKTLDVKRKIQVFNWLLNLGIRQMEVGYPASSEADFDACAAIGREAPKDAVIAVLARCNNDDIGKAIAALMNVRLAMPRLHIFIGMSEFHMANVLRKEPKEVKAMAVAGVKHARANLDSLGLVKKGQVQFSPEHFGDCQINLDWVIETLQEIVVAGADVINLPNTVERTRPSVFADMVRKVVAALPPSTVVAVHCHNDLGMATATTVESYFAGAQQLEVTLNGLGERAGNTSLYETAVALSLAGVSVGFNLERIYETALRVSELTGIPISAKAPIIGAECLYHRSGIHQHGASLTFERPKGAYRPFDPALVGRAGDEQLRFTSQSGYTAVLAVIKEAGHLITEAESRILQPALKAAAESKGELTTEEIMAVYQRYVVLRAFKKQITPEDVMALAGDVIRDRTEQAWRLVSALAVACDHPTATISLRRNDVVITKAALGDGAVDAAFAAIRQITGVDAKIEKYRVGNLTPGADSLGEVVCGLRHDGLYCEGRSIGTDVVIASVNAYLDALNQLLLGGG